MTDKNNRPVSVARIQLLCTLVTETEEEIAEVIADLALPGGSPSDIEQDKAKLDTLWFRRHNMLNDIAAESNRETYNGEKWESLSQNQQDKILRG